MGERLLRRKQGALFSPGASGRPWPSASQDFLPARFNPPRNGFQRDGGKICRVDHDARAVRREAVHAALCDAIRELGKGWRRGGRPLRTLRILNK